MRGIDPLNRPFIALNLKDPLTSYDIACKYSEIPFGRMCNMVSFNERKKIDDILDFIDLQDCSKVTILYQRFNDDPTLWENQSENCYVGLFQQKDYRYSQKGRDGLAIGDQGKFVIKKIENMDYECGNKNINLFPFLKQLLKEGNCLLDSDFPEHGKTYFSQTIRF